MRSRILPTLGIVLLGTVLVVLPAFILIDPRHIDPARLLLLSALVAPVVGYIAWSLRQPETQVPKTIAARERESTAAR
jgi:hypothetical protein